MFVGWQALIVFVYLMSLGLDGLTWRLGIVLLVSPKDILSQRVTQFVGARVMSSEHLTTILWPNFYSSHGVEKITWRPMDAVALWTK